MKTRIESWILIIGFALANIKFNFSFPHELSTIVIQHENTDSKSNVFKELHEIKIQKMNTTQAEATENIRKSQRAHISDFTNPRTGLNPFLDLVEGTYTGSNRQGATIPEKPTIASTIEIQTYPPPPYHRWPPDIIEGSSNPRQKLAIDPGQTIQEGDSSHGRIQVFPTNVFPFKHIEVPTTPTSTTVKIFRTTRVQPTRKCEPSKPLPDSGDVITNDEITTTASSVPNNNKRDKATIREKNLPSSSSRNFTIGITIVGVAVIFFTVMLATCLWKQRTKRLPRHATLRSIISNESTRKGQIHI